VTGLDGQIQKGQKVVNIAVGKAIPILGIRNASTDGFRGQSGIKPIIDFNGAVDLNAFNNGTSTLTVNATNPQGEKIGQVSAGFSAAAVLSYKGESQGERYISAGDSKGSFYGGLPKNEGATKKKESYSLIKAVMPEALEHYIGRGGTWGHAYNEYFTDSKVVYSAAYGSGIESGKTITLTLDQAASGDAPIQWKASLPVTVTYM
ncbi:TPA: hypothetical protein P8A38_005059, partial [Escherichia coli]|nr:hypothetical protein [Escherichia coli]